MSVVELRVELPAYSHSFLVQVSETSTISDLKAEIARICPGAPQVHGQRIIWRGRTLRDEENVSDLWKVCILINVEFSNSCRLVSR